MPPQAIMLPMPRPGKNYEDMSFHVETGPGQNWLLVKGNIFVNLPEINLTEFKKKNKVLLEAAPINAENKALGNMVVKEAGVFEVKDRFLPFDKSFPNNSKPFGGGIVIPGADKKENYIINFQEESRWDLDMPITGATFDKDGTLRLQVPAAKAAALAQAVYLKKSGREKEYIERLRGDKFICNPPLQPCPPEEGKMTYNKPTAWADLHEAFTQRGYNSSSGYYSVVEEVTTVMERRGRTGINTHVLDVEDQEVAKILSNKFGANGKFGLGGYHFRLHGIMMGGAEGQKNFVVNLTEADHGFSNVMPYVIPTHNKPMVLPLGEDGNLTDDGRRLLQHHLRVELAPRLGMEVAKANEKEAAKKTISDSTPLPTLPPPRTPMIVPVQQKNQR